MHVIFSLCHKSQRPKVSFYSLQDLMYLPTSEQYKLWCDDSIIVMHANLYIYFINYFANAVLQNPIVLSFLEMLCIHLTVCVEKVQSDLCTLLHKKVNCSRPTDWLSMLYKWPILSAICWHPRTGVRPPVSPWVIDCWFHSNLFLPCQSHMFFLL